MTPTMRFTARKDSTLQDSGLSRSGEQNLLGLKQIPTVELELDPGIVFNVASQDNGELNASPFNLQSSF